MNIVDSIIIGVSLLSILIVIIVIARSFKKVDREIIQDIQNNNLNNKEKKITVKLKQAVISFLEWFIRKLKQGIQQIHSWVIKEKKKSKSEFAKAKDEFIIENNKNKKLKNINKADKQSGQYENTQIKEGSLDKIFLQKNDETIDSVVRKEGEAVNKKSFIKGLFKGMSRKKKSVDIRRKKKGVVEEWSLEDTSYDEMKNISPNSSNNKKQKTPFTEDAVLGVDRKILEKKILQKIDKDPANINNYHELGELYIKMKKYDDAMEVFGYILSVNPDDLEAKRRQGKIKLLKKSKQ